MLAPNHTIKRLIWLLATVYEQYILLLDIINSNYYKAKHLSWLFFMVSHEQWWIIFGNVKIFQDKSYNAVYSRISRVAGSKDWTIELQIRTSSAWLNNWGKFYCLISDYCCSKGCITHRISYKNQWVDHISCSVDKKKWESVQHMLLSVS